MNTLPTPSMVLTFFSKIFKNRMHLMSFLTALLCAAQASAYTVTGTVTVDGGSQIGNVQVCVNQTSPYVLKCGVSAANGNYSIPNVSNGTYRIDVQQWGTTTQPSPTSFSITGLIPSVTVSGDTSQNVSLPFATLSGTARDAGSNVLAGVTVSTNNGLNTTWTTGSTTYTSKSTATTALDGTYSMVVLKYANYTINAKSTDPVFSPYVTAPVDIQSSRTWDITLPFANAFTGTVTMPGGIDPVGNVQVCAYSSQPYIFKCAVSQANGFFAIQSLPEGMYRIDVQSYGTTTGTNPPLANFSITGIIPWYYLAINANQTMILPFHLVSGVVTKTSDNTPIEGATVQIFNGQQKSWTAGTPPNQATYTFGASTTTAADGSYSMYLIGYDKYAITATPPNTMTDLFPRTFDPVLVQVATTLNFKLSTVNNYKLTILKSTNGTVSNYDIGILCGFRGYYSFDQCSAPVDVGTQLTMYGDFMPYYCSTCVFNWMSPCSGGTDKTCEFTMPPHAVETGIVPLPDPITYNITFIGNGYATIQITKPDLPYTITCSSTDPACTAYLGTSDLPIDLVVTPDQATKVEEITGDCQTGALNTCTLASDYPDTNTVKNITVVLSNTVVAAIGTTPYLTVQDAYNAAVTGDTIKVLSGTIPNSPVIADRNITVLLEGGYDPSFTSVVGLTSLVGKITGKTGKMMINNLSVQ